MLRLVLFCTALAASAAVFAHGAIHDQLRDSDRQIARSPRNAGLYVHRGRLYLDEGHFEEAQADFRRALQLEPQSAAPHYFLGETLLQEGDTLGAESEARLFLDTLRHEPGGVVRGQRLLGRSLAAQYKDLEAAAAYRAAIDAAATAEPAQYLECAAAYVAAGAAHWPAALQVLDAGIAKLGPLTTLQEAAVDLEIKSARPQAAVARLDALAASGQGAAYWLFRKGEILRANRENAAAEQAYTAALQAAERQTRRTKAQTKLRNDVENRLKTLRAEGGTGEAKPGM